MDLQQVLNSITFFNGSNFTPHPSATVQQFALATKDLITQAVSQLYYSSPTARQLLEDIATSGGLNFGFAPNFTGAVVQPTEQNGQPFSDKYIMIDPARGVSAINQSGEVYDLPFIVTLGHELVHYATGKSDPVDPANHDLRNETWNNAGYDWVGEVIPVENTIVQELISANVVSSDPAPFRAGYLSSFATDQLSVLGLQKGISYTDDKHVDVVRFGDLEDSSDNDNIDMHDNQNTLLIFGLEGNDDIRVGLASKAFSPDGNNYVYGGAGDDRLFSNGRNYVFGGEGNDVLVAEGPYYSRLFGGDGNDRFRVAVESGASMNLGEGADTVYLDSNGPNGKYQFSVHVESVSADDVLYWNGKEITGGVLTAFDYEEYQNEDGSVTTFFVPAVMDEYTNIYTYADESLNIRFADGTFLIVSDFQNGDLGMSFNMNDFSYDWYDDLSSLPRTEFAFNGNEDYISNVTSLWANYEAVAYQGPHQPYPDMFWM